MNTLILPHPGVERRYLQVAFTLLIALISLPVHGFWRGLFAGTENWMPWTQIAVLGLLLATTYFVGSLRLLRGFVLVNLALHVSTLLLFTGIAQSAIWGNWFGSEATPWRFQGGEVLLKSLQMLMMIGVLWGIGLRPANFYLARGHLDAPVEAVRWLGIGPGKSWLRFGPSFGLISILFFAGLLAFGYRSLLVPEILSRTLPLLPTVLLFAALNALYEEVVYKAAPLSQLEPNFGKHPALWLTAFMFGLGHFTESYFLPGMSIVLPAFLGYMMSKSILETRGLVWAWIIHFGLDVVIFSFLAFAAVS